MDVLLEKEKKMRDYWLNALGDKQAERLETDWFSNDVDSELLEIVRADLIDDYITKNLTDKEYLQFEKHFLANNIEDIFLAKSLIDLSLGKVVEPKKNSFTETILNKIRSFAAVPQVAIVILLLVCSGLLGGYLIKSFFINEPPEIAGNNESAIPTPNQNTNPPKAIENVNLSQKPIDNPAVFKQSANSKSVLKNVNSGIKKTPDKVVISESKNLNANNSIHPNKEKANQSQVLVLTVFRGNMKMLKLSNSVKTLSLKLDMPGIDKVYKHYELRIYDANNNLAARQMIKENLSVKKSGDIINGVLFKTDGFKKKGLYKPVLVGIDEKNEVKELCLYDSFKVN